MKRDFNKLIEEGRSIIKDRPRMDMSIDEISALLDAAKPGEFSFLLREAFLAGVATGSRISNKPRRTATK